MDPASEGHQIRLQFGSCGRARGGYDPHYQTSKTSIFLIKPLVLIWKTPDTEGNEFGSFYKLEIKTIL